MREFVFDGAELPTPRQVQDALAERMEFPEWYGRNLDALHDCLGDIREETLIILLNWEREGYQAAVLRVMRDVATENDALCVIAEEKEDS
jgi:ribonuclease inhibitor